MTGGIGSGKTFVCHLLHDFGIEVYDCDAAAKRIMATSEPVRRGLINLVGPAVYDGHVLQKRVLAEFLLASEANKQAVDNIVHPAVAADFLASDYSWLESAILFDSHFNKRVRFDYCVCVSAPLELRLQRVMQRDHISREKALAWIHRQLPQEDVARHCDFVIENDGHHDLRAQIAAMLSRMQNKP